MRKAIATIAVVIVSLACTTFAQKRVDAIRRAQPVEEVLYFPNERLLDSFTCGQSSIVADILWLKCIQYTSEQFHGDFKFTLLDRMLGTITRMDPHFVDAYKWGGIFLAMLKRDDDAGIRLLESGIPHNPRSWELPFEIARTYVLNRHDEVMGARWMAVAAATGDPPQFVIDWAKNLQQRHGLAEIERAMWQEILQSSSDQNMKETAARRLIEIDVRVICEGLNAAVAKYREAHGKTPATVEELVSAGVIDTVPPDPLGGRFFINSRGVVQNTSLLDSQVAERRVLLESSIKQFQERNNRLPASLDELRQKHFLVPTHPYLDRDWRYNPATGQVH